MTLLQSLAGSTFDSSQLVLTACMGYHNVNETRLQELRNKHRPAVLATIEERSKGLKAWKDSKGLASKLYSFKKEPTKKGDKLIDSQSNGSLSRSESGSSAADDVLINLTGDGELDSLPDLQEQVCTFCLAPLLLFFSSSGSSGPCLCQCYLLLFLIFFSLIINKRSDFHYFYLFISRHNERFQHISHIALMVVI